MDRSAAYAARYVAKNIVAAGLAERCELQVSYAIGVAEPISITVETFGTGKVDEAVLVDLVRKHFDLRPVGLVKMLDLLRPIYQQTAAYGHFGRDDVDLPWERTDKAEALKADAGIKETVIMLEVVEEQHYGASCLCKKVKILKLLIYHWQNGGIKKLQSLKLKCQV